MPPPFLFVFPFIFPAWVFSYFGRGCSSVLATGVRESRAQPGVLLDPPPGVLALEPEARKASRCRKVARLGVSLMSAAAQQRSMPWCTPIVPPFEPLPSSASAQPSILLANWTHWKCPMASFLAAAPVVALSVFECQNLALRPNFVICSPGRAQKASVWHSQWK